MILTINEAARKIIAARDLMDSEIELAQLEAFERYGHGLKADDLWFSILRRRTEQRIVRVLDAVGCETLDDFACELAAEARHDEAYNADWTHLAGLVTDGVRTPRTASVYVEAE
jgi:hypothetical protein